MNDNEVRVMPHDLEAEQAVLSSMLFDRDAVMSAYEIINSGDFYAPANQVVFDACIELFSSGKPVDLITVKNKLAERNLLDRMGGMDYLAELAGGYFTAAYVGQYAGIIYEKSVLRKLIKASGEISALAYRGEKSAEQVLEFAEKSIMDISRNLNSSGFSHIRDALGIAIDNIEAAYLSGSQISGVASGFTDLDMMTTGFKPSDLVLIAARPSMGKTAFAMNIAQNAALKGITVAVFSLEMSKEQLANRMLCSQASVDSNKLRSGMLESEDWERLLEALGQLAAAPIYIDDNSSVTSIEVRAKCRRLKLEKGLGMIVIDYLQLMSGAGRSESRQQEISEITRSLKALAREMEVPVIALSQLSRACEMRKEHRPMLSDLRESGAIEQDADVVTFLYRDERYDEFTEDKGIAEVIIAKQRNGPTGTVRLRWLDTYTRFRDLDYGV